ncbi:hypothetical protein C9J01_01945 [Photobacterium rosenbergii]|uniref:Uncharacterized protein n=1 Tax=Photobacterium rosenbergii TaxID=294936 RepID=A0A2T3NJV7_9GAMM|nr:hypothetical protein C9J01_01945 [Photobacterium rosenbergii]
MPKRRQPKGTRKQSEARYQLITLGKVVISSNGENVIILAKGASIKTPIGAVCMSMAKSGDYYSYIILVEASGCSTNINVGSNEDFNTIAKDLGKEPRKGAWL